MANNGIYYSSGNTLNFTTNNTTWATLTSGGTFQMSAVSATTYYNLPPATFTGGTVSGATNFTGGLTANTISATTYFNLPVSAVTNGTGISASTSDGTVTITNTSPDQTVTISGGTGITTGGTYPNFTIVNSAPDQTVTITGGTNMQIVGTYPNFGINFTGSTTGGTSGDYLPLSGGTVTGNTTFTSGLTATTVSATTYQNLPYSGTVNGGGTTNYIPKFTGSTGIGNSQLQDDGSQVFTNQGYGSPLTGNLSINASGTTGIAGRATQYGVYGTISGATAGASAVYGEASTGQYGVYGINQGDAAGEYIGVYGRSQQSDSGVEGTVYIGGKFYGDNGTGEGYSVQLQDGTEGVGKVLVSQTSDGKANWNTFSGINITITSAATNTLVFSAATGGGGGGGVTSVTAGTGLSGNSTTGNITLITNISASSISNATTVGQNLITLPNPSAISYLRINADNTVTSLTLSQLKTDLGLTQQVLSVGATTALVNTFEDTGFSFPVTSGKYYRWKVVMSVGATNSACFGVSGTTVNFMNYRFTCQNAANTVTIFGGVANDTGTNAAFSSNGLIIGEGYINPSASGTFKLRFRSLTAGALTIRAGSSLSWEEVL